MEHRLALKRSGLACAALVFIAIFASATPVAAQSIDVRWDANTESNLAGYRVFVGLSSGSYSQSFDVSPTSTTFSFLNPTPNTRYYFVVAAFNSDGDQSTYSNEISAVLGGDTSPPNVTITSPSGPVTVTTGTLAMAGTASDNVAVTRVSWSNSRGGSGTATGTTAWTANVALQSGTNVITVTADDGENTRTASVTVTYNPPDGTLPNITITSPSSNVTVTASPMAMSGTASDNVGVTSVTWSNDRGGNGTATGTTAWSASVPLVPGANVITITARDAGNNARSASRTVTYNVPDTTAPAVAVTAPTGSPSVAMTSIQVAGTASDTVGVTRVSWVNSRGGSGNASGTTSWSAGVSLQLGTNVITVTARDAANNTSTAAVTVTNLAMPLPSMPVPVLPSGALTTATPSFMWTRVGTASSYQIWVNDASGNGRIQSTFTSQAANCSTATGLCTVSPGVALNGAGQWWVRNVSGSGDWSAGLNFTAPAGADTTAPNVAITTPVSGSNVTTATIAVLGTASDNVGVTQVTWTNDRGGNGTASGTNSWSANVALQTGANVITVTARDAANNTRTASVTVNFSVPDTSNPNVAITSPSGPVTVTTSPIALNGTASDNVGVVQVSWSNNRGGSGTAAGTTSWTIAGVPLFSGSNVITVTARDAANNTRQASVTVTYNTPTDTTAPNVAITSPAGAVTVSSGAVSMSGTASDNVGVTQVTWANNRGGSGSASGTTSWAVGNVPLQAGTNVITVTARDAANNTRQASVTVDYIAGPTSTVPVPMSPSGMASSSTPSFTWTPAVGAPNYQIWVNDSSGNGRIQGIYSAAQAGCSVGTANCTVSPGVALTGSGQWWVRNVNVGGDWGTSRTFTVPSVSDTTAPNVTIGSPSGATTVTSSSVTVSGSASDNVGVTQVTWSNDRGGNGTASGTTSWSANVALQSGANVITVTARDAANNTRSASVTVTFNATDTTPPAVTITSPSNGTGVTTASIALSGAASDAVGVTQVTWSNNRGGGGSASGTTFWSVSSVPLQAGANVITVTARDAANNSNQASVTVNYAGATSTVPVPVSPGGTSTTSTPSFTWTAAVGAATYQLWVNDSSGNGRIQSIFTSAQAGCSSGVGSCTASPGVSLVGNVQWWVRNAASGDWGPSLTFTVTSSGDSVPPNVAITMPASSVSVTGAAVALAGNASDNVGVTQVSWSNDRGGNGTATGTNAWSVSSVPLQVGTNVIIVTARDGAANARQASIAVTYVPPAGPTVPFPVSPTGVSANATPTFIWTAVPSAISYQIWANDSAGNGRIQHSFTASQAGCGGGTGTCSASPGVTLTGTVQWWVRVVTPSGDWSSSLIFAVP